LKNTPDLQRQTGWGTVLPFYYGWLVLAASAVSEMLVLGATSYSAGLFVLPLQAEFHLSRASANLAVPLLFLGAMAIAPFAGRMLDSWPIRKVMSLGTIALCLALVTIALTSSLTLMVLALLLPAAMGWLMLGPLTTSTLVSRWFHRRRGLALGIAAVATSGGSFTVVPLMSAAIQAHGWRTALLFEAATFLLAVLALTFLIIRDAPAALGLEHHRETRDRREPAPPTAGMNDHPVLRQLRRWKDVLGNRAFWAPALMVATISGLSQGIVVSAVPYGVQLGVTPIRAAAAISIFGLAAAITKIVAGIVSDLLDQRIVLFLSACSMTASLALLYAIATFPVFLTASVLAGIALGGALPTSASMIASRFGSARFGATMAWAYVLIGGLTIAASVVAGTVFDRTGGYHAAFALFLAFCVTMAILSLLLEALPARKA
jgi:sugar phosphate permease